VDWWPDVRNHDSTLRDAYAWIHRIVAQILNSSTHEHERRPSADWPPLQDLDLVVGPGRRQYASFVWEDLWAIAPWMEERISKKIDGQGLGN
jgi:hypothetical protein